MLLTDVKCRNAKPKDRPYDLRDGKGLYLEIRPSGGKFWRYRFTLAGKESTFTIGEYAAPAADDAEGTLAARRAARQFSVAEARAERQAARSLVRAGVSPVREREQQKLVKARENANTFRVIATEWLALRDWQQVTKDARLAMLNARVFPAIGDVPVRQITSAELLALLRQIAKEAPTVANAAKRTISSVFDFAVSTLRAETDPVYPIRKAIPANKTQHKRALSTDEIGALLRDLDGYSGNVHTVAAFKLMWWTLARPSEVAEARWSEIDLDAARWTIPAERMKMRRVHTVPLPTQAVAMLRALKGIAGRHDHVFPNRDRRSAAITDSTFRQALKNLGWSGRYSPHATRTTGSTRLNELGYHSDWIERQLAHVEQNAVRRTYNHADYLSERQRMMQTWADLLDGWRAGARVVAIHRAA